MTKVCFYLFNHALINDDTLGEYASFTLIIIVEYTFTEMPTYDVRVHLGYKFTSLKTACCTDIVSLGEVVLT